MCYQFNGSGPKPSPPREGEPFSAFRFIRRVPLSRRFGEPSLRTNPASSFRESQRDSVTQPSGCRVGEATLGSPSHSLPTPTGLRHGRVMDCATPLGLKRFSVSFPRVARGSQPWAGGRNLVGIREVGHRFLRNDQPRQLSRVEGGPISHHAGSETGAPAERARLRAQQRRHRRDHCPIPSPSAAPPFCARGRAHSANIPRPASHELRPLGFPRALGIGTWTL